MNGYVKIADVTVGTTLIADGGFTCIEKDTVVTVDQDDHGRLYIPCSHGQHILEGQERDDYYIGLRQSPH